MRPGISFLNNSQFASVGTQVMSEKRNTQYGLGIIRNCILFRNMRVFRIEIRSRRFLKTKLQIIQEQPRFSILFKNGIVYYPGAPCITLVSRFYSPINHHAILPLVPCQLIAGILGAGGPSPKTRQLPRIPRRPPPGFRVGGSPHPINCHRFHSPWETLSVIVPYSRQSNPPLQNGFGGMGDKAKGKGMSPRQCQGMPA